MITMYESDRLIQLIRNKNKRHSLNCTGNHLSFNIDSQKIVTVAGNYPYTGRQDNINLLPRLVDKHARGLAFEVHLQAYITQNIGLEINPSLDATILGDCKVAWLGNEVSCGVGMQRIDIVVLSEKKQNQNPILIPIELKAVIAHESNIRQIQRYIDWIQQYYIPNQPSDIQPVLLTKKTDDKETEAYKNLVDAFKTFNEINDASCTPLRFIEFSISENNLIFESVAY